MKEISLRELLEAGCHFGHRAEKWHPKAGAFIYQKRGGIHIIDLAKTKESLDKALEFIRNIAVEGKIILFIATKRQAKGVVKEACNNAGIPFIVNRWIGGFLTNWEEVKKNVEKMNRLKRESLDGSWSKFPKHETVKLQKEIQKLKMVYEGVAAFTRIPDAVFIVDIKKENNAVLEAERMGLPTVAIVDTNSDPSRVTYSIPANDDAVGSIQFIVDKMVEAYKEGVSLREKEEKKKKDQNEKRQKEIDADYQRENTKPPTHGVVLRTESNKVEERKKVVKETIKTSTKVEVKSPKTKSKKVESNKKKVLSSK